MIKDKRKILILILGIILIYLDISFIIRRQIISLNRINLKIKTLKQHQLIISKGKDLKDRLEALRGQFHSLKKKVISEKEIPDLIDEISKIANKVNLKINKISPFKDPKATFLDSPLGRLYPLSILIELSSGYHQLGKFLNLLESNDRFLKVEEMSIVPQTSDLFCHRVKLTLRTFYIRK